MSDQETKINNKPFWILAMDGGGVRGIATIQFLADLETAMRKTDSSFRVGTFFDMYAGTSIGAIIAALFTHVHMPMPEAWDLMRSDFAARMANKSVWDRTMGLLQTQPKYDGRGKTTCINEIVGTSPFLKPTGSMLLCPAYDVDRRETHIFRSWSCCPNLSLASVLDVTSAAPVYFPTRFIEHTTPDVKFTNGSGTRSAWMIDGGVVCNNPSMCAIAEATRYLRETKQQHREIRVLNVGTGITKSPINGQSSAGFGAVAWMRHDLLGVVMDETYVAQQAEALLGDQYLRITGELTHGASPDLDESSESNKNGLLLSGREWWTSYKEKCLAFFKI